MLDFHRDYPSLGHAYARVHRAKQHLTNFKRQAIKFLDDPRPVGYPDYRLEGDVVLEDFDYIDIYPILPILVSEVIYNLRSALDYLVFEMSILDCDGKIEEGIPQFVIENQPGGWQKNKWRLQFLTDAHQARIEELQPFKGCQWTGRLRDLSNPDKHRSLHLLRVTTSEWISPDTASDVEDVLLDKYYSIAFRDENDLVEETLKELIDNITSTLAEFEPDFPIMVEI